LSKYLLAAVLLFSQIAQAEIVVHDAWVRGLPPGQGVTAAFMRLENTGTESRSLVGAKTTVAERAEIHQHVHSDGMMSMRRVQDLPVPAGKKTTLQPGGYHLMLFGLKRPLKHGQRIELGLEFDDGSTLKLLVPVTSVLNE
jgi:copper(I)-binding protein